MSPPVVISGAGPVGLMLACELGLAGVETVVLERLDQPNERSRGLLINATVVELLGQRGLMESLEEDGFELPMAHFAHIWLDPSKLPEEYARTFAIPHSQVERRLEERAAKLGVEVHRGQEVIGLEQDETGVTVRTRSGTEVRGSYLVGCDGVDSAVRRLAGIDFPGTDPPFNGIIADVEVEDGDPLYGRIGGHLHDAGVVTVGPAGPQLLRIMIGEFGVEPADRAAPATFAELREGVERVSGFRLTTGTPRWLIRWTIPTRQAEQYRAGRVFLAGDAAHVHFPLGGQALSTGIEDAVNLGWKLAAELRGGAPAGLLDTYHRERHPVGARACLTTRAQAALMHPPEQVNPLREILTELIRFSDVNEYLVKMVGGLDVRYEFDGAGPDTQAHPLLGHRLADIPLTTEAGETSVARLLQPGRGVLLDLRGGGAQTGEIAQWADRVDAVAARPTSQVGATALLFRPDGRVAWAQTDGDGTDGLLAALRTWFGE